MSSTANGTIASSRTAFDVSRECSSYCCYMPKPARGHEYPVPVGTLTFEPLRSTATFRPAETIGDGLPGRHLNDSRIKAPSRRPPASLIIAGAARRMTACPIVAAERNIQGEAFFGGAGLQVVDLKLHMAVR